MSVLKEFKFGEEGLRFMKERLAEGKTLSRYLLKYCNLGSGVIVTFLPSNVSTLIFWAPSYHQGRPATLNRLGRHSPNADRLVQGGSGQGASSPW